ncbi:Hypothetical protein I595_1529 [Croceitalea dokdonensis DOKDO 023]|uniref:Uncharacterized protein n=1 Tax=Croceitalea dokdonensis DOKDO 023 TaxID=1300341 RepID=A0A0P7A5N3_9FLAO|nr:Hypothetical protein I595_1529 [Croceitalea dokdonensis DOKDO 023]
MMGIRSPTIINHLCITNFLVLHANSQELGHLLGRKNGTTGS